MVRSVMWPHEVVYSPTAQPIVYENISSMAFMDGYITVMSGESLLIKNLMLTHLQELIEDGECCRCLAVRAYHATWLQHIEKGWATWGDEDMKIKLRQALVGHWVVPVRSSAFPSGIPSANSQTQQQPAQMWSCPE